MHQRYPSINALVNASTLSIYQPKTHPKHTKNTRTTHLEEGSGTTLSKELRRSS
jgi:hypothetical protein